MICDIRAIPGPRARPCQKALGMELVGFSGGLGFFRLRFGEKEGRVEMKVVSLYQTI